MFSRFLAENACEYMLKEHIKGERRTFIFLFSLYNHAKRPFVPPSPVPVCGGYWDAYLCMHAHRKGSRWGTPFRGDPLYAFQEVARRYIYLEDKSAKAQDGYTVPRGVRNIVHFIPGFPYTMWDTRTRACIYIWSLRASISPPPPPTTIAKERGTLEGIPRDPPNTLHEGDTPEHPI